MQPLAMNALAPVIHADSMQPAGKLARRIALTLVLLSVMAQYLTLAGLPPCSPSASLKLFQESWGQHEGFAWTTWMHAAV